jgi:hypothetical protein
MTSTQSVLSPRHHPRIVGLMVLQCASMVVTAVLHLSGVVQGRSNTFNATAAGIAEAVICAVLLWGAIALGRRGAAARGGGGGAPRPLAIGTTLFAIIGFIFGLSISASYGALPDIVYHSTVLCLLIVTLVLIVRIRDPKARAGQAPRQARSASRR